ncbi:MAG: InlB B-repeat-containing protein, partial [Lachnospiraceae bacterium]|nr:InlB B-repeat-containing protein [Lachnospiraceae bacterium]
VVISSDLASNLSIERKSSMTIAPGQTTVSVKYGSMSLETTGWTFTSGDTSILTVSSSGVINALQEGTTYVRASSTSNSTFYAEVSVTVEIPSYTVTFKSQGGSSVDSQTVKRGTEISDLPTPTKAGYTFDGWYTSSSGGTLVTSLTVSENVTLYAHWSVQTYMLSFDTQGGTSVSSQTVNANATVYSLPTTTRSGYTFNGWYTSSSGGTRVTYVKVTADTTLYAQWTKTSSGTSTVSLGNCKITSLTNKASGIVVKWQQVENASGYYVYRKVSGGSYSRIATITDASTVRYEDTAVQNTNGTVYKYKVLSYSGSTKGTGTAKTTVRLTGSALKTVTNSALGKAKVKWTAVSDVTGYQIQYSTSSSFSSYKTKKVSGETSVSKTLSSLTQGKTYYVRIRTYKVVNGKTYYSAWSSKLKVKITK